MRRHSKRKLSFIVPFTVDQDAEHVISISHNNKQQPITDWVMETNSETGETIISCEADDIGDNEIGTYILNVEQDLLKHVHTLEVKPGKNQFLNLN